MNVIPVGQDNRQQNESVEGADDDDAEIHPKIENGEDLGVGEDQDDHAQEVGHVNAGKENIALKS